jgi:pSer/pThr/pTyr-binding forkhead associated (FHA) protein
LILYLQEQNQSWNVKNTSLWIGWDKDCDLQLEAARYPDLSGKHVTIIADVGGRLAFRDQNSTHGTFKNGSRVSWGELHAGDTLRLGPSGPTFEIRTSEASGTEMGMATAMMNRPAGLSNQPLSTAIASPFPLPSEAPMPPPSPSEEPLRYRATPTLAGEQSDARTPAVRISHSDTSDYFVAPPSVKPPPGVMPVGIKSRSEDVRMEQKLNRLYQLTVVLLLVVLIMAALLVYQNQLVAENKQAILNLQQQASSSVQYFAPQADQRMKALDEKLDSIDPRLQGAEDHMVARMNTELPRLIDRYIADRMSKLARHVEANK